MFRAYNPENETPTKTDSPEVALRAQRTQPLATRCLGEYRIVVTQGSIWEGI